MVEANPNLLTVYLSLQEPELQDIHWAYLDCLNRQRPVDKLHSQNLRLFFHQLSATFSKEDRKDEDAHEALVCFLTEVEKRNELLSEFKLWHKIKTVTTYQRSDNQTLSVEQLQYERKDDSDQVLVDQQLVIRETSATGNHIVRALPRNSCTFDELMSAFWVSKDSSKEAIFREDEENRLVKYTLQEERQVFESDVSDLVITFGRFTNQGDKNNAPVRKIPLLWTLPETAFAKPQERQMELTSFIVHKEAHYVTYRKQGSAWYLCDDASVVLVPESKAKKVLPQSYILYYSQLEKTFAAPFGEDV
jgi:hypothetical protein